MNDLTVFNPDTQATLIQIADRMAAATVAMPDHIKGNPGNCYLVAMQAHAWGMNPFMVAQGTSVIHGKMMFEGKLVAGALGRSGIIKGALNYKWEGEGQSRKVIVTGFRKDEDFAREVTATVAEAKTSNGRWQKDPDTMLSYYGARKWARIHAPEIFVGYNEIEFEQEERKEVDVTPAKGAQRLDAIFAEDDEGDVGSPKGVVVDVVAEVVDSPPSATTDTMPADFDVDRVVSHFRVTLSKLNQTYQTQSALDADLKMFEPELKWLSENDVETHGKIMKAIEAKMKQLEGEK